MNYAACYCEENIWHLCADPVVSATQRKVVWVSSVQQICPIWYQRSAVSVHEPVWWDYHVFLLAQTGDQWQVWDLDTLLGLPVEASAYFAHAFRRPLPLQPVFRVMDASYYRRTFSSDRSHMMQIDGSWMAAPPAWPAIENDKLTFDEMRDMRSVAHGELFDLEAIEHFVSSAPG